jgi:hypothetical protein
MIKNNYRPMHTEKSKNNKQVWYFGKSQRFDQLHKEYDALKVIALGRK